jgi:WD40 repeat protein
MPDGSALITQSKDQTICRWELPADGKAPGKASATWKPEHDQFGMALSPDGSRLAVCSVEPHRDGHLHLLSPKTLEALPGSPQAEDPAHPTFPAFTTDGGLLLAWSRQGIAAYDRGEEWRTMIPLDSGISGRQTLVGSADGSVLTTCGGDGRFLMWDLASGRLLTRVFVGGDRAPAISPDGRFVAAVGNGEIKLFELRGLDERRVRATHGYYPEEVLAAQLSPHEPALACFAHVGGYADARFLQAQTRYYHLSPARRRHAWDCPAGEVATLAFHPKAPQLLSSSPKLTHPLMHYDLDTGQHKVAGVLQYCEAVRFAPAGMRLFVVDRHHRSPDTFAPVIGALRWPDMGADPFIFDNSASGTLYGHQRIHSIDTGMKYLVAGTASGHVLLFDIERNGHAASGRPEKSAKQAVPLEQVRYESEVNAVAIAPDDSLAVAGLADGTLRVLRLPNLREIEVLRQHSGAVRSVRFSPDGSLLASGSDDHTVRLWRRGQRLEELLALPHGGPIRAVSIGHRSALLSVLVREERAVRVWRLDQLRRDLADFKLDW